MPAGSSAAEECLAGLARCSIRLGDAERAVQLATASGSASLLLQCAQLLEEEQRAKEVSGWGDGRQCAPWRCTRCTCSGPLLAPASGPSSAPAILLGILLLLQAGLLYMHAGEPERAARLFLACREFVLLDGAMERGGGSPAVRLQYAQAKEGAVIIVRICVAHLHAQRPHIQPRPPHPTAADLGSFVDAARAYERAGEPLAAARVYLERLGDAEAAADVAQRCQLAAAHLAVARFCEQHPAKQAMAVQAYCAGGDVAAAGRLAQRTGCMPALVEWARRSGGRGSSPEAALLASQFLEAQGRCAEAGKLCALAGLSERAAALYIQVWKKGEMGRVGGLAAGGLGLVAGGWGLGAGGCSTAPLPRM